MSLYAEHGTPPSSPHRPAPAGGSAASTVFLGGVLAAGLGLGVFSMAVLALWIISPYPDSGPGGALRVAADVWLLAHGADLVRGTELGSGTVPVGLTPLACTVVPCTLLYRAARHALDPPEDWPPEAPGPPPRTAFAAMLGGYLLVAAAAVLYASYGPVRVAPLSALLFVPLCAAVFIGAGVWTAAGRPGWPAPPAVRRVVPAAVRRWFTHDHLAGVVRAGIAATVTLLIGGTLLLAAALGLHAGLAREAFAQLSPVWSGRVSVAVLCAALLPNAVVWAAAYGLGTGFTVGAGSVVAPLAVAAPPRPRLPDFPLLAALPAPGPAGPAGLAAAAAVTAATGAALARAAVRRDDDLPGRCETAATAVLGAVLCGVLTMALGYASGGPVGRSTLAAFGPCGWRMGATVAACAAAVGVPGALVVRWRRGTVLRAREGEVMRERTERLRGWRRVGHTLGLAVEEPAPRPVAPVSAGPAVAPERRSWWRSLAEWFGFRVPGAPVPEAAETVTYEPETLPLRPRQDADRRPPVSPSPEPPELADPPPAARSEPSLSPHQAPAPASPGPGPARERRPWWKKPRRDRATPPPTPEAAPQEWHDPASREARWAALKNASGDLVPAFEPQEQPPQAIDPAAQ
ncbi:cell division protein PerM [Streptomyces mashuensis]|uniref:cell division protein PerM n=1 Tax=Streptomyces mashuensis TaxID=33904 RepID=UPI00167E3200|nr:DUF6350 family protein [Streptomyces mashuensis]